MARMTGNSELKTSSSRARKAPFCSAQYASELRAAMLAARCISMKQQHLPVSSACEDYAVMVNWGEAMRMGLVLSGVAPMRGGALDEALEAVLSTSFELVTMLRQPRWGLHMPSTLNPLVILHERLARSVELLLLVRARAAPMLPPEVWALVVERVLCIGNANGGCSGSDGAHTRLDDGTACGESRPVLRHYGFASDGTLRLALDPPLHLPHLRRFRACVAAALDAALSSPVELEGGRGSSRSSLGSIGGDAATAWRSVRLLIASFARPVPKFALGPPAVAVRSSAFLTVEEGAVQAASVPTTRSEHGRTCNAPADEAAADDDAAAADVDSAHPAVPQSRFEGVRVRVHIAAVRLRGLVAETAAAATGS